MYAIIDCDNCFVSCERVFRPDLIGKPVCVLSNNDGCVVARSNEAKALGIKAGLPYYQLKERFPNDEVIVFSSNYELYGDIYDLLSFYDEITTEDKKLKLVVETEYHPSLGRSLYDAKTLIKTCQVITPLQIRFYNINDNQYVKGVDVYDLKKEFMKRYDISIKDFDKKIIEKKLVDTLSIKLADISSLYKDDF